MSDRDQLRDELIEVLYQEPFMVAPQDARRWADALLPIVDAQREDAVAGMLANHRSLDRIARSRVDPYLLINACRIQHTGGANPAVDDAVEAIVVNLFNGDAGAELARGAVVKGSPGKEPT